MISAVSKQTYLEINVQKFIPLQGLGSLIKGIQFATADLVDSIHLLDHQLGVTLDLHARHAPPYEHTANDST